MLSPLEAKEFNGLKSRVNVLYGLMDKCQTDLQVRGDALDKRMTRLEGLVRGLTKKSVTLSVGQEIFDDYVSRIEADLRVMNDAIQDVTAGLASYVMNTPEDKVSESDKRTMQVETDELLPITNPKTVAVELVKYLKIAAEDTSATQVVRVDNRIYADLADAHRGVPLPLGATPVKAMDALRRARLTKRSKKHDLEDIGWKRLPVHGVCIVA